MSMIYVAAPYSHPDKAIVAERMDRFAFKFSALIEQGHYPVSPLLNHFVSEKTTPSWPTTWEYWEGYSKVLLSKCDSMIVLTFDGWEDSPGVQAEIKLAEELNIGITYV